MTMRASPIPKNGIRKAKIIISPFLFIYLNNIKVPSLKTGSSSIVFAVIV